MRLVDRCEFQGYHVINLAHTPPFITMHIALNAQLISTSESYRGAGVSNYSLNLLRSLGEQSTRGAAQNVFSAFVNARDLAIPGVALARTRLPLHNPLARIAWEQSVLPRLLRRMHVDLMHGLVNVLPLATRLPGVVTVHDLAFLHTPDRLPTLKAAYLARLCKASVERAVAVIAVSQQTADDMMRWFGVPASKITVVHNGVADDFTPAPAESVEAFRVRAGLPERYLLYLGTLEPRKNLDLLISAFASWRAEARPEDRSVKLILAGAKGWFYEDIFQQVDALGLQQSILFPGFVPRADLPNWYRAAEGFIYPSVFEGFGLPLLEAMACGTPVLCSDAASLREVAGDAALIFPVRDQLALVNSLHLLIDQAELRAELRRRGLVRAAGFSWRRAASETLAIYNSCGRLGT